MTKKFLGVASVLALLAAPVSVVADEAGGAMGGGIWDWMSAPSAVEGVKNGALATIAVAAGAGLGIGLNEALDDDSNSSTTTTTSTN